MQSEEELPPPPAQAASDQEEEAEDDEARMQGTDIEQGNAKVCSPTAAPTLAVLSSMLPIMQLSRLPQYATMCICLLLAATLPEGLTGVCNTVC